MLQRHGDSVATARNLRHHGVFGREHVALRFTFEPPEDCSGVFVFVELYWSSVKNVGGRGLFEH